MGESEFESLDFEDNAFGKQVDGSGICDFISRDGGVTDLWIYEADCRRIAILMDVQLCTARLFHCFHAN